MFFHDYLFIVCEISTVRTQTAPRVIGKAANTILYEISHTRAHTHTYKTNFLLKSVRTSVKVYMIFKKGNSRTIKKTIFQRFQGLKKQ